MTTQEFEIKKSTDDGLTDNLIISLEIQVRNYTRLAWFLVGLGTLIYVGGWTYYFLRKAPPSAFKINELGDFIAGTAGSLWALAGLIYIFVAFIGQKIQIAYQVKELRNSQFELRLTREEMELQRGEMKRQSEETEKQGKIFNKQNFEQTLFSLIQYYKMSISDFKFQSTSKVTPEHGLEAFRGLIFSIVNGIGDYSRSFNQKINRYNEYFQIYEIFLSPYLRTLYRVFKYIDETEFLSESEKYEYAAMVRGFLSSLELSFLYFNGIGNHGIKFKYFIEKYSLLKHMDYHSLKDFPIEGFPPYYHPIAFASGTKRAQMFEEWVTYSKTQFVNDDIKLPE